MSRIVNWIQAFAASIGGPGLFIVAFLDSSFLSLPEINDLLVVAMVIQDKGRWMYYATMATLGSIAGCLLLYALGRKGGDALVRRRFGGRRLEQAMALSQRYGVLAVAVPAILPPPAPFKVFVVLAGVSRVPAWQFAIAVAGGRGFRYFVEAALAVRYGDDAIAFIQTNGRVVSIALAVAVLAGGIVYVVWRRRREAVSSADL